MNQDRHRTQRGFSLIEVLIASLLVLMIALAIIPLFTMSALSNVQGNDSTKAANYARERLEQLWQLPFSDPRLTITAGTTVQSWEYYDEATRAWVDLGVLATEPTWPDGVLLKRITTVRQFSEEDLATPLPFDTPDAQRITIKELEVEIKSERGTVGGGTNLGFLAGKSVSLLAYRSA